jgi:hypothetical protein
MPPTEFDLVYAQAVDLFKAFPEYEFKTVAALTVIIGWLVTSDGAQAFIKTHAAVTLPGTELAFGLLIVLKSIWILGHYRRMNRMHCHLVGLAKSNELPPSAVEMLRLGPILPITYFLVNVVLSTVAIAVVWLICSP